ncbi:MAG: hypothetical protein ACSHXK_00910 [Oceanococcus sp.]
MTSSLALLVLGVLGSGLIAYLGADFHAALMQQIAQSGLAVEQDNQYQSRGLTASHHGQLQLSDSYCPGCGMMQYDGTIYHGLGTLLDQTFALASARYQVQWPELALEPALPPLQLRAQQGLFDGFAAALQAQLSLPESSHIMRNTEHAYRLEQGGVQGQLKAGHVNASSARLAISRNEQAWLQLTDIILSAAADEKLILGGEVAQTQIPAWQWQGDNLTLNYQQQGSSQRLDAALSLHIEKGRLSQQTHGKASADLNLQRLNLQSTLAFARELPALLAPQTSSAARMLGLFSLYSIHGPGFFSPHPTMRLKADAIPLALGQLEVDITLAVTPQTRRPPMHPLEWRRALQGRIKITAPAQHLAFGWHKAASFVHYITGLPTSYQELKQHGWVKTQPDGRDQLLIVLDPETGPRQQ